MIKPWETFSYRLKCVRHERKLSQAELAKRSGLQIAAISHFETGRRKPSFDNLLVLRDALNISLNELVDGVKVEKAGSA